MRARILLAALVLAAAGGLTRAQDKPLERADLDKRAVAAVYDTLVLGTDLYNAPKGNHEGCFRLYQGTLMTLAPLLDHRPALQKEVRDRLDRAKGMKATDGATELRAALDAIQNAIAPVKTDPKGEPKKPLVLWERLGGEKGVKALVHTSVLTAADDPKVTFLRDKKLDLAKVEQAMVALISASSEGPVKYSAADMKAALGGVAVTDAEFDALKLVMAAQLKKALVADADVAELGKAVEGTRKDIVEPKK